MEKKKITYTDYKKAIRTIEQYESQLKAKSTVGKYQFLWYTESGWKNENYHARWVPAKNIEEACKKFAAKLPSTIWGLDYEVRFNDTFINIYDCKLLAHIVR